MKGKTCSDSQPLKRGIMRQKFLLSRNLEKKELRILEYAVIDKDLKQVATDYLRKYNYLLIGEETYRSEAILDSISRGNADLVGTLRTHNIFPISIIFNYKE